jgi:tetraacyldisaccharide 4'-kinase
MTFKTPWFWYRDLSTRPPLIEHCLKPLSAVYHAATIIHHAVTPQKHAALPVICIGNINAGGSGKTPVALAIHDLITKHGIAKKPFFLSRGYGRAGRMPLLVDTKIHKPSDTGDEAMLLAAHGPTIVSGNRYEGIQLAEQHGSDLIIMDDGLQNPAVYKDIKFAVVNGDMGFGNGLMIPAGPLRAPLHQGLSGIDAVILIGQDKRSAAQKIPADKIIFTARLIPAPETIPTKDARYLAFAGLGYNEKFFRFLREDIGLSLADTISFSDHHPYTEGDLLSLHAKARSHGLTLLTTEKDMMRIPPQNRVGIHVLRVHITWDNEMALTHFIRQRLAERP